MAGVVTLGLRGSIENVRWENCNDGNFTDANLTINGAEAYAANLDCDWTVVMDGNSGVLVASTCDNYIDVNADNCLLDNLTVFGDTSSAVDIASGASDTKIGAIRVTGTPTVAVADNATDDSTQYQHGREIVFADNAAVLATTTGAQPYVWTRGEAQVIGVRAVVGTAPTGATLIVDVNVNGSSLWALQASQPTIAISGTDSGFTRPDQNHYTIDRGDVFKVDIDQVGSTVAGGYLTVQLLIAEF